MLHNETNFSINPRTGKRFKRYCFFMWILLALRRGCSNKKSGHKVDDTLRIE